MASSLLSVTRAVLFSYDEHRSCPYFDPKWMRCTRTFTLRPREQVLVVFNTRDVLLRYTTCCDLFQSDRYEQLCILLWNTSDTTAVTVNPSTPLSRVMSHPCIHARDAVGHMDEITLLLARQKNPAHDDDDDEGLSSLVQQIHLHP